MNKYALSLLLLVFMAACTAAPAPTSLPTAAPLVPTTAEVAPSATVSAAATASAAVTVPAAQVSTVTVTNAATATLPATATAQPTATPTPEPMSISVMRAREYLGSDITLERELEPGANYHRYYASYLSDGLKIYGLLTVPNGDPPPGGWPAIIFNHGYIPPSVYQTTERYVAYVDGLARNGYIVYKIDYRGHDQSEGQARGAYGDPGYTIDVLNAVSSIKRFPQANPQKIGMWGHSMGGFLTLRAMVISPDIKVGVIWSGVVGAYPEMLYHWRRSSPTPTAVPEARGWRNNWLQRYGTPEENPDFWNSVSANAFLGDLSGPLQLHATFTDEEVPAEFSQQLAQQGQAAGKTVELYTYEGDNHNLSHSFNAAMARTVEFYNKYLK